MKSKPKQPFIGRPILPHSGMFTEDTIWLSDLAYNTNPDVAAAIGKFQQAQRENFQAGLPLSPDAAFFLGLAIGQMFPLVSPS